MRAILQGIRGENITKRRGRVGERGRERVCECEREREKGREKMLSIEG